MIIVHHYTENYSIYFPNDIISYPITLMHGGQIGNMLFMMMSGFFMGGVFLDDNKNKLVDVGKYVVNRYWRFWPQYAIAVTVITLWVHFLPIEGRGVYSIRDFIVNFLFIIHTGVPNADGSHWFLATLLKLQIALSLMILIPKSAYRVRALLALFLISFTIRFSGQFFEIPDGIVFWTTWMGYITLGALLRVFKERKEGVWYGVIFSVLMVLSVVEVVGWIGAAILWLLTLFFIFIAYNKYDTFILESKPCVAIGSISFSWYLVHQNIGYSIQYYFLPKGDISMIYILIPMSVTLLIAFVIEKAIARLPKKLV